MEKFFEDRVWKSDLVFFIKKVWILIIAMIITTVITLLLTATIPNVYRSQSTYYLNKSDLNSSFFTINELQFYNLLLLDVQRMLKSYKFYNDVIEQEGVEAISYDEYINGIYINIDTESTFFDVGYDNTSKEIAKSITDAIEQILPEKASEVVRITTVELIDEGIVYGTPVSPNRKLILMVGISAGFAIGIGIILILYLLTRHIRTSIEAEIILKSKLVNHIRINKHHHIGTLNKNLQIKNEDFYFLTKLIAFKREELSNNAFVILCNDLTGKSELFALKLASQMAQTKKKTLLVVMDGNQDFKKMLDSKNKNKDSLNNILKDGYIGKGNIEKVSDDLFVLANSSNDAIYTQAIAHNLETFIESIKNEYAYIIIVSGMDSEFVANLTTIGPVINSVTSKSKRKYVTENYRFMELINANIIGVAYQE